MNSAPIYQSIVCMTELAPFVNTQKTSIKLLVLRSFEYFGKLVPLQSCKKHPSDAKSDVNQEIFATCKLYKNSGKLYKKNERIQ